MDFEKLKTAAEEISLSNEEKEKLILACENAKKNKKKNRLVPVAAVAAAAVFVVIMFSPGFLFRAKSKNNEAMAAPEEDYFLYADEFLHDEIDGYVQDSATGTREYRAIYYQIPEEFAKLVSEEEFIKWQNGEESSQGMPVLLFIRDFQISRESFEKANADYAKRIYSQFGAVPLLLAADCAEQENFEIFNAEVIYSFNSKKINDYYRASDYLFNSLSELFEAVQNGYSSISEKAPEELYCGQ